MKRAASEGPSSAALIPIDHITDSASAIDPPPEHEIDAYMAEQGEDVLLRPVPLTQAPPPTTHLSIQQKAARIKQLRSKPMVAGEIWYIISREWFRRWEIACGIVSDKTVDPLLEENIGPPDNSSLFDAQGNLVSSLVESVDVEFLPQDAWSELVAWCVSFLPLPFYSSYPFCLRYGHPINPLPRTVISQTFSQTALELRPPRLKVLVLKDLGPNGDITGPPHPYVTVSIKDTMKTLFEKLVAPLTARRNVPYKIWKIDPGEFPGSHFPASKLVSCGAVLMNEEAEKTVEGSMIEPDDPFVVEFQENGSWISDAPQLQASVPTVHVPPPLFGPETDFFSRMSNNRASVTSTQSLYTPSPSRRASSSKENETSVIPFNKSFGFSKTSFKTIQEPGTLGLGNMYALKSSPSRFTDTSVGEILAS